MKSRAIFPVILILLLACKRKDSFNNLAFLNHSDSVTYVGIETCKSCHSDKYETFIHTGMGSSFGLATREKSSADFSGHPSVYDADKDFWYEPYWENDELYIREFRLNGGDTVFLRKEKVSYIIGSGQHTNSHLYSVNGYVFQMPLTFYTQQKKWDLPPGFEKGFNSRFSRKIGFECMSCHNAMPEFVEGSENKFKSIPMGIDCERCHGPGSLHVAEKRAGKIVDVTKVADRTIVNPGKLTADLQFDICQRCHLQGNAVLKEGMSFESFRPGMKLSDIFSVFLPVYEGGEDEFLMASHADRLRKSRCFIHHSKNEKIDSLHPARGMLTCVTCHNPHVSVKQTKYEIFITACKNCHSAPKMICSEKEEVRAKDNDNCVHCHMPRSAAVDIPHVTVTDHYIRIPVKKWETEAVKKFVRLASVNDPSPSPEIKVKAFLQQYEKFEKKKFLLDSARNLLLAVSPADPEWIIHSRIHLLYLEHNLDGITQYVLNTGDVKILSVLEKISKDNQDAWTAYRIGEAFQANGNQAYALKFYSKAYELAEFVPEFGNKLAGLLIQMAMKNEAGILLLDILGENPGFVPALNNLGYLNMLLENQDAAFIYYQKGLSLDPDYIPLLMNVAGYYFATKEILKANIYLKRVLKLDPGNQKAKSLLKSY